MTAQEPNRSVSDNSVSRPIARDRFSLERDPRTRRIVEYTHDHNGATSGRDIAAEAGWTLDETEAHLQRLEAENYVQLVGEEHSRIVLITGRGERLARDAA